MVVYVDDVLITRTGLIEIQQLKIFLQDSFMIKDMGKLCYFLGLKILYKSNDVLISQRKFVL